MFCFHWKLLLNESIFRYGKSEAQLNAMEEIEKAALGVLPQFPNVPEIEFSICN